MASHLMIHDLATAAEPRGAVDRAADRGAELDPRRRGADREWRGAAVAGAAGGAGAGCRSTPALPPAEQRPRAVARWRACWRSRTPPRTGAERDLPAAAGRRHAAAGDRRRPRRGGTAGRPTAPGLPMRRPATAGAVRIATCALDGSDEWLLTEGFDHCDGPDYTPDGAWIWFNGEISGRVCPVADAARRLGAGADVGRRAGALVPASLARWRAGAVPRLSARDRRPSARPRGRIAADAGGGRRAARWRWNCLAGRARSTCPAGRRTGRALPIWPGTVREEIAGGCRRSSSGRSPGTGRRAALGRGAAAMRRRRQELARANCRSVGCGEACTRRPGEGT